ncbi:hypothetical protein BDZ85DRAFT_260853 [Elsinoe ampelina]|uniref:Uncharacterized protein n=1 Tax=Elsinoe ampelina TaxID=302913 RepID=A0A6A6GFC5_9PEZI|nr:hypothetical protein BDZ85DRAFT_260853 [Elsinoe ampelina]
MPENDFSIVRQNSLQIAEFARHVTRRETGSDGHHLPEVDRRLLRFVTANEQRDNVQVDSVIWKQADIECKKFLTSAVRAQKQLGQKVPIIQDVELERTDWSSVAEFIKTQANAYESGQVAGGNAPLRKCFRKFSENAQSLDRWLAFLPNTLYTAPLSGSIKIVLQCAQTLHEVRDDVLKTFAEIPDVFLDIRKYTELYHDRDMQIAAAQLYISLAIIMRTILEYMVKSSFKKAVRSILGRSPAPDFAAAKDGLEQARLKFGQTGKRCLHERLGGIERTLLHVSRDVYDVHGCVQSISDRLRAGEVRTEASKKEIMGLFYMLFQANRELTDELRYSQRTARRTAMDVTNLLDSLIRNGYEPETEIAEVDEIVSLSLRSDVNSLRMLERAAFVKESEEFQDWIFSPRSSFLFVQDCQRSAQPPSSLSTLCSELHQALSLTHGCTSAIHFCSDRSAGSARLPKDGKTMLRDILGQLLDCWQVDWPKPELTADMIDGINQNSTRALSETVHSVLSTLTLPHIIFIFIDSVDEYDYIEDRATAERVLQFIMSTVEELSINEHYIVKVLITAPSQCSFSSMADGLASAHVLHLPSVVNMGLRREDRFQSVEAFIDRASQWR